MEILQKSQQQALNWIFIYKIRLASGLHQKQVQHSRVNQNPKMLIEDEKFLVQNFNEFNTLTGPLFQHHGQLRTQHCFFPQREVTFGTVNVPESYFGLASAVMRTTIEYIGFLR